MSPVKSLLHASAGVRLRRQAPENYTLWQLVVPAEAPELANMAGVATAVGKKNLTIVRLDGMRPFPWLVHGFSTRLGGSSTLYGGRALNLGFTPQDAPATVMRNRAAFLKKLDPGKKTWTLVTLRQIHSDLIHCVFEPPRAELVGDGLVTNAPGLLLGIQTADCLPVILVDPRCRSVGVFHAGWRGTIRRIVQKGVAEMMRSLGSKPSDLVAAIGPGVHACCYQVGRELEESFASQFAYSSRLFREVEESDPVREKYPLLFLTARAPGHLELPRKLFLDLVEANRRQLIEAGISAKNVHLSPLCSSCESGLLFSYRAEKGVTGRMLAVAGVRE